MAWCAQRSVRWEDYIFIETYHDSYHDYPRHMLFDLANDPHEQFNLAEERPDLLAKGISLLHNWHNEMMETASHRVDPLQTVLSEGGPLHSKDGGKAYIERLKQTGRAEIAERFEKRSPNPTNKAEVADYAATCLPTHVIPYITNLVYAKIPHPRLSVTFC